ncbi:PTS system system cellobiose-specific transporter subunit IIC [Streptococcus pneumoniae]|nr:PTS system system cellobiose-specific transporter subunit IIC [Streptococcus pneumoniae]VKC07413.1 PTS system system cellobiose-specific transporter subunit IIC [Streptococcus pneumoniae]VKH19964.1 PTS system system cellobiose-specific transporter subunit IIC [Streptococcus pneumoniae]VLI20200.1 PTS system system cellobiose-specific transporter subunit IIC [Streptococcus pneumoniae]VLI83313.1 PTS system system cellobiose-specific transporter subunit IIC [Streptococcus pneumoniae]
MKNSKFIDQFATFAGKLGNQIHLKTLRDAFVTVMPLYILAGLIVLLNNTVFKWIFQGDTLTRFQYWGITIANGTLSISGMIIAVMVGYFLAKNRDFENPLAASMLSLVSLIVMMPNTVSVVPDGAKDAVNISGVLSFNNTGTGAMFAGVIVAIIATELFIELSNVKALQMNLGENIPPAVSRSFSVLLPVMTVISLFGVVSALLFNITGMNLISIITIFIQEPIRHIGTSLIGVIIIYSLGNMLWLFGIHQAVIYSAILEPLLLINITENITAANNGQAIPHIINLSQIQTFALMGGSGSTLCLLLSESQCCL